MSVNVALLPRDVLLNIFSYFTCHELVTSVQFVCTWWQDVCRERCLWKNLAYEPSDVSSKEVKDFLRISPPLRIINLSQVSLDKELFRMLVDRSDYLEQLSIRLEHGYFDIVFSARRSLTSIKMLNIVCYIEVFTDLEHLHNMFPSVEHLEMYDLDTTVHALVPFLRKKRETLHTLSLKCSTDDDCCILPYLEGFTSLKNLALYNLCNVESVPTDAMKHLRNITSLSFYCSYVVIAHSYVLRFFPNLANLEFYLCDANLVQELPESCPGLERLTVSYNGGLGWGVLDNLELEGICGSINITHLNLWYNYTVSDEGIEHLRNIQNLTHLDIYECESLTMGSLKSVCSFTKLQVLKFDVRLIKLSYNEIISNIKNLNLRLKFYNCNDLGTIEQLRKHLNVSVLEEKPIKYLPMWMKV